MRRHTLGLIALCLLVLGALLAIGKSVPSSAGSFAGGAIKAGLVLGACWLALPQIDRILAKTPGWLLVITLIVVILIVIRPWSAIIMIPLLTAIWMLSMKFSKKR